MIDLPRLRTAVGYSPYSWHQVYTKAKLSRATYRYWRGERPFPLEVAIKIAYIINVPLSTFLTDDGLWLIKQVTRK